MIQAGYTYEPAWNEEIVIEPRKQRIVKKVVKKKANKRKKLLGKLGIGLFLYGIFLVGLCIQSASLGYQGFLSFCFSRCKHFLKCLFKIICHCPMPPFTNIYL
jgi:hypothetical protein